MKTHNFRVHLIGGKKVNDKNICEFCNKSGAEEREHGTGIEKAHRECASAERFELGGSD